jgi:peptide/nickel transport system substrate-binding protein
VQADLAEIGINLTPVPQATTVFQPAYRASELPMVISYWAPDWMDTSTLIDSFATPTSLVAKRLGYVNEENAKLSAEALVETDPAKRAEIYAQIIRNLQEDAHLIGMVQPKVILASRDNISSYYYHPVFTLELYAVQKD